MITNLRSTTISEYLILLVLFAATALSLTRIRSQLKREDTPGSPIFLFVILHGFYTSTVALLLLATSRTSAQQFYLTCLQILLAVSVPLLGALCFKLQRCRTVSKSHNKAYLIAVAYIAVAVLTLTASFGDKIFRYLIDIYAQYGM